MRTKCNKCGIISRKLKPKAKCPECEGTMEEEKIVEEDDIIKVGRREI